MTKGLTLTITSPHGITVTNAYHHIVSYSGDENYFNFTLCAYSSEANYTAGKLPLTQTSYTFTPDLTSTTNFLQQAYDYLMSLDDFSGYTEVTSSDA